MLVGIFQKVYDIIKIRDVAQLVEREKRDLTKSFTANFLLAKRKVAGSSPAVPLFESVAKLENAPKC